MNAVLSLLLESTLSHKRGHSPGNNLPAMGHAPSHDIWATRLPAYVSDAGMTTVEAAWATLAALEKPCPGYMALQSGVQAHYTFVHCPNCNGTGYVPLLPMLREPCRDTLMNDGYLCQACLVKTRYGTLQHSNNCSRCEGTGYTVKRDAWALLKAVEAMGWHADYREQEWTVWRGAEMLARTAADTDEPWSGLVLAVHAVLQEQKAQSIRKEHNDNPREVPGQCHYTHDGR